VSTARPTPLGLSVSVHLRPGTEIRSHVRAVDDLAWLSADGPGHGSVTVFGDRAELLRLRDALTEMVTELDRQRAALAA
jgi:hypothetical protein